MPLPPSDIPVHCSHHHPVNLLDRTQRYDGAKKKKVAADSELPQHQAHALSEIWVVKEREEGDDRG